MPVLISSTISRKQPQANIGHIFHAAFPPFAPPPPTCATPYMDPMKYRQTLRHYRSSETSSDAGSCSLERSASLTAGICSASSWTESGDTTHRFGSAYRDFDGGIFGGRGNDRGEAAGEVLAWILHAWNSRIAQEYAAAM